ncbi:MAG: M23 family metallopeptidase [Flavobacteriaceae bacterium]|nr:M23 family metallopeptidase [Flavobacteriaceae bacterium]
MPAFNNTNIELIPDFPYDLGDPNSLLFQTDQTILTTNLNLQEIVPNQKERGCDSRGCGHFGAPRGGVDGAHQGFDIIATPGTKIYSPIDGVVERFPIPYPDDPNYSGIEIRNGNVKIKIFYASATVQIGQNLKTGDPIAIAQDISAKYDGITQHVHIEVYVNDIVIDPEPHFTRKFKRNNAQLFLGLGFGLIVVAVGIKEFL